MKAQVIVREFRPEDQEAARALIVAGLGEHFGFIDETLNRDLDDIAAHYAGQRLFVADHAGTVVGTGFLRSVDETTAEVVRMSVAVHLRRAGIASAILEALLAHARHDGYACVVLSTLSHWQDAVGFYTARGFRERARAGAGVQFELIV